MPTEKASTGFEEIYREQRQPLLRFAYLLSGSRETSEDVVQTAFTSAQPRWDQIESPPRTSEVGPESGEGRATTSVPTGLTGLRHRAETIPFPRR